MHPGGGGRMPRMVLRAVLMLLACLVLAPAGAQAASPVLTSVSAPGSVVQNGRLTLTLKLRNAGRRPTKPATLRVLLSADRKRDGRDVTLSVAVRVPAVPGRRTKTVQATTAVPATVKPGSYYLLACAKACKATPTPLRVTAKPVPAPGGGDPAPAP